MKSRRIIKKDDDEAQLKLPSSKLEIIIIEKVSESVRSKKEIHLKKDVLFIGVIF